MANSKAAKVTKRKSSVISSQTYRKMVEDALEESEACALDLHGIYDALALKYEQYRADSVAVDWRVSPALGIHPLLTVFACRTRYDTACRSMTTLSESSLKLCVLPSTLRTRKMKYSTARSIKR